MSDQQLTEALLSYRGDNPTLFSIAHGMRLGLGKSTPEDKDHFEALATAQAEGSNPRGERVAKVMRECAQGLASEIEALGAEAQELRQGEPITEGPQTITRRAREGNKLRAKLPQETPAHKGS